MYNVWIVDDEPFILEGLCSIVDWQSLGLIVAGQAENGVDALERIGDSHVDILITDISMPEMNGLELMRELKKLNPRLACIILSGYNEFDFIKEGMRIGIENYLLKPINIEELTETLRSTSEKLTRSRIQTLGDDQIELLKDNIMYRWITNRISKEQWTIRSDYLQLRLEAPFVAAAIFKTVFPAADSGSEDRPRVLNDVRKFAADYMKNRGVPSLCFMDMDGQTVLLLGAPDASEEARSALVHHLAGICEAAETQFPYRLLASLGSFGPGLETAPASYSLAAAAQDYALLHPHERVLDYNRVGIVADKGGIGPETTDLSDLMEMLSLPEYTRLLAEGEASSIERRICDDFDAFAKRQGVTPSDIRSVAVELIVQMKKLLGDSKLNSPAPPPLSQDAMRHIVMASSLDELKNGVLAIAKSIMEGLAAHHQVSPVVRQVLQFVHTSYSQDFSLKTLGQAFHVHPVYLGQLFQKEMNQTFSDYLNRFRIEKAKELMKEPGAKAGEIARAVGFWDSAYFLKQFKKYVGVSPGQFKKML